MFKFSKDQKFLFAEFCGNFAVAWLAAGLIAPLFIGIENNDLFKLILTASLSWSGFLLIFMLYLGRGENK